MSDLVRVKTHSRGNQQIPSYTRSFPDNSINPAITIKETVASNHPNNGEDTLLIKRILNKLGYYNPPEWGFTEQTEAALYDGIKKFQKDNNLIIDGRITKYGETINQLNHSVESIESNTNHALNKLLKEEGPLDSKLVADRARNSHFIDIASFTGGLKDFVKYRYDPKFNKSSDKYRHALINCRSGQRGVGAALVVSDLSRLKEKYDVQSGNNTRDESDEDMAANMIGRYLGIKYPKGDCDELVQRYIKKNY